MERTAILVMGIMIGFVCSVRTSSAQDTIRIPSGTAIRVKAGPTTGYGAATFVRMSSDSLVYRSCPMCEDIGVPMSSIEVLDVYRGGSGSRGRHVLLGAGAGAAAGALVGASQHQSGACARNSCGIITRINAVAFGFIGLVVGGVAGALLPAERWERVLPHVAIAPVGGASVGLQVRVASRP